MNDQIKTLATLNVWSLGKADLVLPHWGSSIRAHGARGGPQGRFGSR